MRRVPIAGALHDLLLELRFDVDSDAGEDEGLLFSGSTGHPFDISTMTQRACRAWDAANASRSPDEASLEPITLHKARHTFASLMIVANVNAKALSTYGARRPNILEIALFSTVPRLGRFDSSVGAPAAEISFIAARGGPRRSSLDPTE